LTADPVDEEFPGGLMSIEPLSHMLVFTDNFEDEFKDGLHPLVIGNI
jgi:hypothetical protein